MAGIGIEDEKRAVRLDAARDPDRLPGAEVEIGGGHRQPAASFHVVIAPVSAASVGGRSIRPRHRSPTLRPANGGKVTRNAPDRNWFPARPRTFQARPDTNFARSAAAAISSDRSFPDSTMRAPMPI
ncbi:hypothetical protein STAQ_35590 [Allostella sp. ATCC 35155]|nr:hypothetical protein STAQ_35590 [Stella sp. ATCC 35155]